MGLEDQLADLPLPYAVALRLEAAGSEPELIATALGIDREAVTLTLAVAHSKLAASAPVREGPPPPNQ